MARSLNVREVAEKALQLIGAFTPHDSAADGDELNVAVSWLDVVMAHKLSVDEFAFLIPTTDSFSLTGGTASYDLSSALGSSWPSDGIMFPISARIDDGSNDPVKLDILRRDQYDLLDSDETGTPEAVYFDRGEDLSTITLRTWPTLGSGITGYTIDLTYQKFAKTVSGTAVNPQTATGLLANFNLWAIYELAAAIGAGPVRRLSNSDIGGFESKATSLKGELMGLANKGQFDDAIAEPWGQ